MDLGGLLSYEEHSKKVLTRNKRVGPLDTKQLARILKSDLPNSRMVTDTLVSKLVNS